MKNLVENLENLKAELKKLILETRHRNRSHDYVYSQGYWDGKIAGLEYSIVCLEMTIEAIEAKGVVEF